MTSNKFKAISTLVLATTGAWISYEHAQTALDYADYLRSTDLESYLLSTKKYTAMSDTIIEGFGKWGLAGIVLNYVGDNFSKLNKKKGI